MQTVRSLVVVRRYRCQQSAAAALSGGDDNSMMRTVHHDEKKVEKKLRADQRAESAETIATQSAYRWSNAHRMLFCDMILGRRMGDSVGPRIK